MEHIGISLREHFIKDFIAIQESGVGQENYPFVVDIELIIKWLKINLKSNLKKTLKASYTQNTNYIILPLHMEEQKN